MTETTHNFQQLALALHYAHTRPSPVIHRDIKPENILIHPEDARLVITDFGIARSLEPGTRIGKTVTVRGTVGYMAPEQANGIVDPRSDQFGSAVVLFEMLTGYHPIDPANSAIPSAVSLNPELPLSLDTVLYRALATRPEGRFSDMLTFLQAFELASQPTTKIQVPVRSATTGARPALKQPDSTIPSLKAITGLGGHQLTPVARATPNTTGVRDKCREGDAYLKQQEFSQALHSYEEALRIDPNSFYAWVGKGTALYHQANFRRALEAYQKATEIDPNNAVVWVSAGMVLQRLQRYQQAIVHFERALAIEPEYVPAWHGKADAQLGMNMVEEAIASYEQALNFDARSFQAWNGLGNARALLRDYTRAVEAYTQALLINPRSAVAWSNKAEALIQLGHNRAALDALNEATEMDRGYTRAWQLKGDVYESLGNYQEANKARIRARPWGRPQM
jgi:tetratricopeptide (TPR) repeat protein